MAFATVSELATSLGRTLTGTEQAAAAAALEDATAYLQNQIGQWVEAGISTVVLRVEPGSARVRLPQWPVRSAALDEGILTANPAARLRLLPSAPGTERCLTRDEVDGVLAAMPGGSPEKIATEVLVGTGIRFGEMSGLHAGRLTANRVDVVETYDRVEKRIKAYPKGQGRRSLPLSAWLRRDLDEWQTQNPTAESCPLNHSGCRSGLVILGTRGRPLDSGWYRQQLLRAERLSGVAPAKPPDLRHTYASWLIQEGVQLAELQRLLGHSSIVTTMRYAPLMPEHSATTLAAINRPVGG